MNKFKASHGPPLCAILTHVSCAVLTHFPLFLGLCLCNFHLPRAGCITPHPRNVDHSLNSSQYCSIISHDLIENE